MNKPASLRRALTAAVPALADAPDKLLVSAGQGQLVGTGEPSLSFEYRYVLNATLPDFAGDIDTVMVAVMAWVKRNQSDLLANESSRKDGVTFEATRATPTTVDLSLKLNVTESVVVSTDANGRHTFTHVDEPVNEWDLDTLAA